MPRWVLFCLYPVVCGISRIDDEDASYSFDRIQGGPYLWENVYDPALDRHLTGGREINRVGASGRADTWAVFKAWNDDEIALHWTKLQDIPSRQRIAIRRAEESTYFWGNETVAGDPILQCTLAICSHRFNVDVSEGSNTYAGDVISQNFGVKMPPIALHSLTVDQSLVEY
jgi:hypothetical protein